MVVEIVNLEQATWIVFGQKYYRLAMNKFGAWSTLCGEKGILQTVSAKAVKQS